jgi:hypothetical protein
MYLIAIILKLIFTYRYFLIKLIVLLDSNI